MGAGVAGSVCRETDVAVIVDGDLVNDKWECSTGVSTYTEKDLYYSQHGHRVHGYLAHTKAPPPRTI